MEGVGVEECLTALRAALILLGTLTHDDDGSTFCHMEALHPEGRSVLCRGHWLKTYRKKMAAVRSSFSLRIRCVRWFLGAVEVQQDADCLLKVGTEHIELRGLGAHFQKWLRGCFARAKENYAQFEVCAL